MSRLAYVQAGGETRSGPRSSNDDEKCREVRFTFPMRNMQPSLACLDGSSVPDISSSHSTVVRPATEALPYRSSHTHNHAAPRYPASYRNPEEGTSNGHVDLVSGTHSLRHSFQLQGSGVGVCHPNPSSGGELDPAVGMQRPFRRSLIQSSPIHQSLPLCSLRGTAERHSMPSISRSAEMVDDMLEITNTQRCVLRNREIRAVNPKPAAYVKLDNIIFEKINDRSLRNTLWVLLVPGTHMCFATTRFPISLVN